MTQVRNDRGVALLAVVVIGAAVGLLAHAALLLGHSLEAGSRSAGRAAEAGYEANAVLEAASGSLTELADDLPVGIRSRWLTPELRLLSTGDAGNGRVSLLWAPEPLTRLRALPAGVITGTHSDVATRSRIRAADSDPCPDGAFAPALPSAVRRTSQDSRWDEIGPLLGADWDPLPPPPAHPDGFAGAYLARGDLVLTRGAWAGLLVVRGALTLEEGAEVTGYVAAKDLALGEGSALTGLASIERGLEIAEGAEMRIAPCRAIALLVRRDVIGRPGQALSRPWPADARAP